MQSWATSRRLSIVASLVALLGMTGSLGVSGQEHEEDKPERPDFSLRSTPKVAFAPAEILFVAELRGGDDDFEEYYCTTIEWDWDDDTRSESTPDCDPYEPGVSKIRRRFSTRHRFDYGGRYEVRVNLKRRDDTVASARTTIEIRGRRLFE